MKMKPALLALLLASGTALAQQKDMTFFVTGTNMGKGADLGGLAGADQHCQSLAQAAGAGNRTWHGPEHGDASMTAQPNRKQITRRTRHQPAGPRNRQPRPGHHQPTMEIELPARRT